MNCFGCKNSNCKRIQRNYDMVVIKVPLFNGNTILMKGSFNVYDQSVSIKYEDTDYCFVANNKNYLRHRLRLISEKERRKIFIYNGIARLGCCNEQSIRTLNSTYLRLFIRASVFYGQKTRIIEDISIRILKPPITYEERMEKWYGEMDTLRSILVNKV